MNPDTSERTPSAAFNDALFARLRENDVVCAVRGGGIRFSPHFHTPLEHLDQAVAIAVS